METLQLILPAHGHKDAAWMFRQEHLDAGQTVIHGSSRLSTADSYEEWLDMLEQDLAPGESSGRVPAHTYFAFVGDTLVGIINIRHKLNDYLLSFGGHIGYGVRPTQRGNGYATQMLALALERCRELGLRRVLITCDKTNPASARVITKNGGVFEDERTEPDGTILQRYWIEI